MRFALTAVLLVLVLLKARPDRVASAVGTARPAGLAVALVLTVPFLYMKALRWYLMLRATRVEAGFGEAVRSLIGGMGLALITPARLGELVRVAYLPAGQRWKVGGLVLIDKGFDVLVLAGLSIAGAWVLIGPPAGLAFTCATALGLLIVYYPGRLGALLGGTSLGRSYRARMGTRATSLLSSLDTLSARDTSIYLGLTVAAFAIVLLQFGVILLSWRSWSPEVVLLTFPLVVLTNVLPLTVGGLGIREGAAALLLAHFGVPAADAALAAFLMFTINTALPGLVGAFLLPSTSQRSPMSPAQSLDRP